ncbi:MAG: nuclear transport factor 2 family protein [Acidovorax sp.]|nr:MAG: nuclear transport factor 2 family protein [Acidovorax sp.]
MQTQAEAQIIEAEERLRTAMLHSDVGVLDELISPDLLFTTHQGQLISKQEDLQTHRSGAIRFHELSASERQVCMHDSFAIVSVRMKTAGQYLGSEFSQLLRYTRVWHKQPSSQWRVVGGHISAVQE